MGMLLYGHGGSGNHGCEAIVRSTSKLFDKQKIVLTSLRGEEEYKYNIDEICNVIHTQKTNIKSKISFYFLKNYLLYKISKNDEYLVYCYDKNLLNQANDCSLALSIGGDNYCYSGYKRYSEMRKNLKKKNYKTVLWGCSVQPEGLTPKMIKDFKQYNLIVARESITYELLKSINPNTVIAPDPAFTLKIQNGIYPDKLCDKPYIGINVSPLVFRREKHKGICLENFCQLINYIINNTDRNIALIPHVVWEHDDDRKVLDELYNHFSHTGRVFYVQDQNCMMLKDIISKCEFFIGARTHATIAAYSTYVPTLVLGYSVKSKGIARDIFGSENDYVLNVQNLETSNDVVVAFLKLYEIRDKIKKHLMEFIPEYSKRIDYAVKVVEEL